MNTIKPENKTLPTIQIPDWDFKDQEITRLYQAFKWLFSPIGKTSDKFNTSVRVIVWSHFSVVFKTENSKELKIQFRKLFHPDAGINVLSIEEKTAVFTAFYPIINNK